MSFCFHFDNMPCSQQSKAEVLERLATLGFGKFLQFTCGAPTLSSGEGIATSLT
jgi:hypothetical protein